MLLLARGGRDYRVGIAQVIRVKMLFKQTGNVDRGVFDTDLCDAPYGLISGRGSDP